MSKQAQKFLAKKKPSFVLSYDQAVKLSKWLWNITNLVKFPSAITKIKNKLDKFILENEE